MCNVGAHVVKYLSPLEMDTATRVQILDEVVCISHSANTLGKDMQCSFQIWVNSRVDCAL